MSIRNWFQSRYRFGRVLGHGGMGVVWEGWRRVDGTEQRVAFKQLRTDRRTNKEARRRFRREARLTMDNAHSGIASVYDLVRHRGTLTIVMEFVDGPSLSAVINQAPLDHDLIRRVLRDAAEALAFLHRSGISHRDVTPGNILVARKGEVKLTDLGLARHRDNTVSSAGFRGTPAYASHEQLAGRETDVTTDVYSLAAIGYQLLTGKAPYGTNYIDVVNAMARGLPPLPEDTPDDLRKAIEGAMQPREERAVQSAEQMLRTIREPEAGVVEKLAAAAQRAMERVDRELDRSERSDIAGTDADWQPQRRRRLAVAGVAAALALAWIGYDSWFADERGGAAVDSADVDEPQAADSPTTRSTTPDPSPPARVSEDEQKSPEPADEPLAPEPSPGPPDRRIIIEPPADSPARVKPDRPDRAIPVGPRPKRSIARDRPADRTNAPRPAALTGSRQRADHAGSPEAPAIGRADWPRADSAWLVDRGTED